MITKTKVLKLHELLFCLNQSLNEYITIIKMNSFNYSTLLYQISFQTFSIVIFGTLLLKYQILHKKNLYITKFYVLLLYIINYFCENFILINF